MGIFIKSFLFLNFFSFLMINCADYKNITQMNYQNENKDKVEFTEIRRLNLKTDLKEYTVITSTKGIKELYMKLNDSKYSRSAPIPVLEEGEYFLVLKPKLKKIKNGDIEIEKLETNGSTLNVFYKEIENQEYTEKKQSDPILILKIMDSPKKIKLTIK
ncbi:hypothetical protein IX38_11675 [Chryseobacterium luteum]|uniref:Uncharacterized protein n=2 Tax=Chryseobacterium luteum TaxID=421531 RepID=A0A085ZGQ5_9FLAO|nr:hypothetical protein IX38_11675 [Chryseobacterium luteum]